QGAANPADQTVTVSNSGGGTLNWTAAASQTPWLRVINGSGANTGTFTVSIDITGLTPGIYNALIAVAAAGASNSPQTMVVNLTVTPAAASAGMTLDSPAPASASVGGKLSFYGSYPCATGLTLIFFHSSAADPFGQAAITP